MFIIEVKFDGQWYRHGPEYKKAKLAYPDAVSRWVSGGYRCAVRIRRPDSQRAVHHWKPQPASYRIEPEDRLGYMQGKRGL